MKEGIDADWTFEERTWVSRRETLLITLFTLDLGTEDCERWLPPFDTKVMISILGEKPGAWHHSRRRKVSQLFLIQFDRLQAFKKLGALIRESWKDNKTPMDASARTWQSNAAILFRPTAPARLAEQRKGGETVSELAARFAIPEESRFFKRLYEEVLLNRLKTIEAGSDDPELFTLIEKDKMRICSHGRPLGSLAVEILVKRARKDLQNKWTPEWSKQLVPCSCDPRIPNAQTRATWWGWATESQRRSAVRALTGLTLLEFIGFLDQSLHGTAQAHQFERRRDFLVDLFEQGRILDARLVVNASIFCQLDRTIRTSLNLSKVRGQQASFICLECTDDVFLIEGTHSFALRGFISKRSFPIQNFWDNLRTKTYQDNQFRVPEWQCDLYQRHHVGNWVDDFRWQLRNCHMEW